MKFWKLNLKIEVLKMEFWKLNLKIGNLKNYLRMQFLKIKFEILNFGKLFENGILKN